MSSFRVPKNACWLVLPCLFCFLSCEETEEADHPQNFIGSYRGIAQVDYSGSESYIRRDTSFTEVLVRIARHPEDGKKVSVSVELPTGKMYKYEKVEVAGSDLMYVMSARGCGCTFSIEGNLQGNTLALSLYEYNAGVSDNRVKVQAGKQ
jgi:hypothetical protein